MEARAPVTVVIPNYHGERLLEGCLAALAAQTRPPAQVVVADNGSGDGSLALLERAYPDVEVLRLRRNFGFAGGANRGVLAARWPLVAVLNTDARPAPDWLERLTAEVDASGPDIWCWGSILVSSADGRVESAADHWNDDGYAYKLGRGLDPEQLPDRPYDAFAAPGAAPLFRRAVFAELGGYEERYFLYYEDVDLAYRALLCGFRARIVPRARVEHDLGASGVRRRTRFYVARNSLWTAVRCVPEPHPRAIARRAYNELVHWNRPRSLAYAELAGRIAGLCGLPWALRERRSIQGARALSPADVRRRLEEPAPLREAR